MAISVRVNPLLERELELAAKRQGVTKSQFIVDAIERALGRKNAYDLMLDLQAQEQRASPSLKKAFKDTELPYETSASRKSILSKLKEKHRASSTR
jgi:hypothetical protein